MTLAELEAYVAVFERAYSRMIRKLVWAAADIADSHRLASSGVIDGDTADATLKRFDARFPEEP